MAIDLDAYFDADAAAPGRYAGQLDPAFQSALAARHEGPGDYALTHTMHLPDGRVLPGGWDLRGSEAAFLGRLPLDGARVLEYGPCSGWLTAAIARQAASVVAIDPPPGAEPTLLPTFAPLPSAVLAEARIRIERVRRGWWFARRAYGHAAACVYAPWERPPPDLGRFHIAIVATVLMRSTNPYSVLQGAAAMTQDTIVVTEPLTYAPPSGGEARPLAEFAPSFPGQHHWWHHSPAAIGRMLASLGFGNIELFAHKTDRTRPSLPLFTIVARRTGGVPQG